MPRGVYKRKSVETGSLVMDENKQSETASTGKESVVNLAVSSEEVPVKNSPKLEPLAEGQAYFESPDGVVIIGDNTKDQIWYRAGNNGRGMFINKKR